MPRLPRIFIKGALYYITCRAESNQNIFQDEGDYAMFLDLLKKYKDQYNIKIFAYSLMPNHLHLLIEMLQQQDAQENDPTNTPQISEFMHNVNNSYTKYFNGRYDRKGHLFRERFKAAIVEKENNLSRMTAYVHLNPKKLNLVVELQDYAHSSYPLYLCHNDSNRQAKGMDLKGEIAEVMGLLENKDYNEFVSGMTQEVGEFIHKNLQRGGILGSDDFIAQVKAQIQNFQKKPAQEKKEVENKKYKFFVTVGGLAIVLMVGAGVVYFYVMNSKDGAAPAIQNTVIPAVQAIEWNQQEWDIKLIPITGGSEAVDTLNFKNGKFISAKLSSSGFVSSNYSVTIESNGKLIWETMQSSGESTASWHGELQENRMSGILSLRQKDLAAQDFSFISIGYRRRE
ncbi:MAG: transposase [Candidatus Omnitrophota bacterium]